MCRNQETNIFSQFPIFCIEKIMFHTKSEKAGFTST